MKTTFTLVLAATALIGQAGAVQIAHYDLNPASGTSLAVTSVDPDFTVSSLNAVGVGSGARDNHFYHRGWDTTINTSKYYELSVASAGLYTLSEMLFSAEIADRDTGSSTATFHLRSDLDGFSTDITSFDLLGGLVTNESADLSGLGVLSGTTTFRWFIEASGSFQVGFGNHEPGGAGDGLADVGRDYFITGDVVRPSSSVPDAGSTALALSLSLVGLAGFRRLMVRK